MPITTLPDEILSCIFEECVEGDTGGPGGEGLGSSPRTLALVNRNWYQVASSTASLWRRILVTYLPENYWTIQRNWKLPATEKTKSVSTHSAMQVCITQQALKKALQRGKGMSLDVTIGLAIYNDDLENRPFVSGVYKTLFSKRIGPRITRLTVDPCPGDVICEPFSYGRRPTAVHLSNLVSLTYVSPMRSGTTKESMFSLIWENAGNLKEISLIGGEVPSCFSPFSGDDAKYRSTIQNLRRLILGPGHYLDRLFENIMPIPELVIQEAAQVECFGEGEADPWSLYTRSWPTRHTNEFTFTRVTSIHLIPHLGRSLTPLQNRFPSARIASTVPII
jgi:F-box-like